MIETLKPPSRYGGRGGGGRVTLCSSNKCDSYLKYLDISAMLLMATGSRGYWFRFSFRLYFIKIMDVKYVPLKIMFVVDICFTS